MKADNKQADEQAGRRLTVARAHEIVNPNKVEDGLSLSRQLVRHGEDAIKLEEFIEAYNQAKVIGDAGQRA